MADPLIFYTNPMSRGQIARWMLEEVGEPYETRLLDYASSMKAEPYLSINPMGKVPAIIHKGKTVTECSAICAYLAAAFPETELGPQPEELADYYRWMFFAAGPVEQAVTNHAMGFDPTSDQERMVGYGNYARVVDVLDRMLGSRAYATGDRFTACDVYLGSQIMWGTQFGTLPVLDSFVAYGARLSNREAYKRGKEIDNGLIAEMQPAE